ncbi:MAG: hypothetical protein ACLSFJ_04640 [Holdemania filiformis]
MVKVTTTTSVNITPDHPTYIAGHAMRTEKFKGVHDEIEAIMLGLQIDGKPVLWIEADISNFDDLSICSSITSSKLCTFLTITSSSARTTVIPLRCC